jgi:4-aminobutyrate aminotransferase-like enzyme
MPGTDTTLQLLRDFESRNVTFVAPDGSWPIVWDRARGVHVRDAEGGKYLDLTAAFGVAAAGHANARVVQAGQRQMARLLHAMGDVHPHALKARLARRLSGITFERWTATPAAAAAAKPYEGNFAPRKVPAKSNVRRGAETISGRQDTARHGSQGCLPPLTGKVIFANSGFEAVEAALKTALLATGKSGVIAFEGAYHGLGYGALNATHRDHFRGPFRPQLGEFGHFVPFPASNGPARSSLPNVEACLRRICRRKSIGAIVVEPIQARGGLNLPPPGFLPLLRKLCDERGALLIFDEIYTGFGRTGKWFAGEHSRTVPDLICLGKALTGGFPLSACVGRAGLMDAAWPASTGEAIHTSTFLGHPVGCAMALAQIDEIERLNLPERAAELGQYLLAELGKIRFPKWRLAGSARGLGLMAGLELTLPNGKPATGVALGAIKALLQRGYIVLPEGADANVISFTPPLTISKKQLATAVAALGEVLRGKR